MTDSDENAPKVHYICQTYMEKQGRQVTLQVDKLFEYKTAAQAQERAAREFETDRCVGADAYMIVEDPASGEVGPPEFLERHGATPDIFE